MLLENKVAVIYGAGGPIGGAVARAFAREGARVFLAGRTLGSSTGWPTRSAPLAALLPPSWLMPRTSRQLTPVSMRWSSKLAPSISRSTLSPTEMSSSR